MNYFDLKNILAPIVLVILLNGCVSVPHENTQIGILDTYKGEGFHAVILDFGIPTEVYSDMDGGRIFSYKSTNNRVLPGATFSNASIGWNEESAQFQEASFSLPPRETTNSKFTDFYISRLGVVYHYRTNQKSEEEKSADRANRFLGNTALFVGVTAIITLAILNSPQE